ncbi:MAG TPA: phosphatidate cytidylyltransferase [Acidimicrobiia bacterium]|nr:phosphatidate cytidylyltransferase [Acidimicrobiia bacterium]
MPDDRQRFTRPWEALDADDVVDDATDDEAPYDEAPDDEVAADGDAVVLPEWDARGGAVEKPHLPTEGSIEDYTHDDYLAATTREYQGLAEEVAAAERMDYERQAVAASMPGVGTGLVGFEDVTGHRGVSEEDVEAEEQQRTSDLTLRIGSGIVLVGLFLGCLFLGGVWFTALVAIVMVLSVGELYATLRSREFRPVALFGFLGVVGGAVAAHLGGVEAVAATLTVATVAVALFYSVVVRRDPLENAAVTISGMVWVSLLSFAIVIAQAPNAVELILLLVLLTAFFDIAAYFVGRAFGRRPIAPVVSPRKTVEGLVGGVVTTAGLAAILSTLPAYDFMSLGHAILVALVVSVFAPLGDAAESVVKRALDTKDMGSILPGHGGMIDRIDALLFVVPAGYVLFRLLDYL